MTIDDVSIFKNLINTLRLKKFRQAYFQPTIHKLVKSKKIPDFCPLQKIPRHS